MTESLRGALRVRVLLSLQRALLGAVTPSLRGVAVRWDEHHVAARFIYDDSSGSPGLVAEVETEVLADFSDDVATIFAIEVAEALAPLVLPDGETWVYRRHEP